MSPSPPCAPTTTGTSTRGPGSHPDRLIPISLMPLWDPQLMAEEIERVAKKGCHAVTFSENPAKLGFPSYHTEHWDPFLEACADNAVTVCLHIGSSSTVPITAVDAPPEVMISLTPSNAMLAVTDIVFSGIFKRFPALQIAMSEGGTGWLPYMLERMDYVQKHHAAWTGTDLGGRKPSEIFHDQFWTCFIDDEIGVKLRHEVGLDKAMWEMDYPHSDSTWPNVAGAAVALVAGPARGRHRQDHPRERHAVLLVRPVPAPSTRALHGRRAARRSCRRRRGIRSMGRRKADADAMKTLLQAASKGAD